MQVKPRDGEVICANACSLMAGLPGALERRSESLLVHGSDPVKLAWTAITQPIKLLWVWSHRRFEDSPIRTLAENVV